jgi:putative ABC transport system permease protein
MTRSQLRKTILAQAMTMGLLALVPGIIAGVGVAYLIHLATLPTTGHPVSFVLHPWLLVGGLILGLIVVLVAALLPAERAARLELTKAVRMA